MLVSASTCCYRNNISLTTARQTLRGMPGNETHGGLAQLARALAWHARGHRFESDILHTASQPVFMRRKAAVPAHKLRGSVQ